MMGLKVRSEEHLLPVIRANLAERLVREGFSVKEIANALNVSQPAVTQYLKKRRGRGSLTLDHVDRIIDPLAEKLVKNMRYWSRRVGNGGTLGYGASFDDHESRRDGSV